MKIELAGYFVHLNCVESGEESRNYKQTISYPETQTISTKSELFRSFDIFHIIRNNFVSEHYLLRNRIL